MGFTSKYLASTSEPFIEYNERGIKHFFKNKDRGRVFEFDYSL